MENRRSLWGITGGSGLWIVFFLFLVPSPCSALGTESEETDGSIRPVLTAQLGHSGPVYDASFSPNGRFVVTAGQDHYVILWDVATGREIRRFEMHTFNVNGARFSPEGTRILSVSGDKTARIWDVETGAEICTLEGHESFVTCGTWSRDGRSVVTSGWDRSVRTWDAESCEQLAQIGPVVEKVNDLALSRDGKRVLLGTYGQVASLWNVETGTLERVFRGHTDDVFSVAFSPDEQIVASGSWDGTVRLWNPYTGQERRRFLHPSTTFENKPTGVQALAFSPEGRSIVVGCMDQTARLWALDTGEESRRFSGHTNALESIEFSQDGKLLLTGSFDDTARLWEVATGREIRVFKGSASPINSVAIAGDVMATASDDGHGNVWNLATGQQTNRFVGHSRTVYAIDLTPDGQIAATASEDGSAAIWDVLTGRRLHTLKGHRGAVFALDVSADGRQVATGGQDGTSRTWNVQTGAQEGQYDRNASWIKAVAFTPDGQTLVTGTWKGKITRWDLTRGTHVWQAENEASIVRSVAVSPDGRYVLTGDGSAPDVARLWNAEQGREIRPIDPRGWIINSLAFSSDSRLALTGDAYHFAKLWSVATGAHLRTFGGHAGYVNAVSFSQDDRWVATGSEDGTVRFWDPKTGEPVCWVMSFQDGSWAVTDMDGRFDASNGGHIEGLHWVAGLETISLDQLKDRYYDPGLLAKHLGLSTERLWDVASFDAVDLFPEVKVELPRPDQPELAIQLKDRGGGIGRVQVLVNGKEVEADARGDDFDAEAEEATLSVKLEGDRRIQPGQENEIEVLAYNEDGYLRSRGVRLVYEAPGEAIVEAPRVWAVVCGVSDYRGEKIDLRYADKDANDFATALRLAAEGLYGKDRVHLTLLSTSGAEGAIRPTRANLEKAFTEARAAGPGDVLVVYLSGHGVSFSGHDGDFHYLLSEAATADLADPQIREATSLSSAELTEWIKKVPAAKRQVLILDTCASGRLVEKLTEKRSVPASQVRALERVKDRTGIFVLAGCAADRASYEATRYGQGLLTYSLLLGMRGGALRDGEYVDVQRLFDFAADHVPAFAKDVGGIQRPVIAQPTGGASFDIGRLPPDVREQVPIEKVKPIFVRASLHEVGRRRDTLSLGGAVDEALRDMADRAGRAPVVFVDARYMPEAYELTGDYVVEGAEVRITVLLWRDDEEVASFEIQGRSDDVPALALRLVEKARQRVR